MQQHYEDFEVQRDLLKKVPGQSKNTTKCKNTINFIRAMKLIDEQISLRRLQDEIILHRLLTKHCK